MGVKREISQNTSEAVNQAYISQSMSYIIQLVPQIIPVFPPFVTNSLQPTGQRIRLNLPKLVIPTVLPWKEEVAMRNLQGLLQYNNFIVVDRATLAFFAIGTGCDIRAAAQCFVNFHNFANTVKYKSPNRSQMEAMEVDGLIEGFARHEDGTFGPLINLQQWNVVNHTAAYIVKEFLCYIYNMVDLPRLRSGIVAVFNARNFT
jgi:hypothetical protein